MDHMKTCDNCGEKTLIVKEDKANDFPKNYRKIHDGNIYVCKKCFDFSDKARRNLKDIITSGATKKLIIGGPGTGKTYTFLEYLKIFQKNDNILIITFINNLVEELKTEISKNAKNFSVNKDNIEVKTLHSFCASLFKEEFKGKYEYYSRLNEIIVDDTRIIFAYGNKIFWKKKIIDQFANLKGEELAKFCVKRISYYKAVGDEEVIYCTYPFLRDGKIKPPKYSQIIIDEYQDFNYLESKFIELLAKKKENKILIAGDDDQAIYGFKCANPKFIRDLYYKKEKGFESFILPYCIRCTEVIVECANYFIKKIKEKGRLKERIEEKEYICYFPLKYRENEDYKQIDYYETSWRNFPGLIDKKINIIIDKEQIIPHKENKIDFLIIYPEFRSFWPRKITDLLKKNNKLKIIKKESDKRIKLEEGYHYLKKDNKSNLGWRIILKQKPIPEINEIIKESHSGKSLFDLLPSDYKKKIISNLGTVMNKTGKEKPEVAGINIKLTTFLGAKGLSADHTFILGVNEGIMPKDNTNISDDESRRFLVAITRPKKSLTIISENQGRSVFINMILNKFIIPKKIRKDEIEKMK